MLDCTLPPSYMTRYIDDGSFSAYNSIYFISNTTLTVTNKDSYYRLVRVLTSRSQFQRFIFLKVLVIKILHREIETMNVRSLIDAVKTWLRDGASDSITLMCWVLFVIGKTKNIGYKYFQLAWRTVWFRRIIQFAF